MDMVQVIGIGMTAVLLILVVRRSHPELAVQITIVVAGIVFFLVLDKLRMIIELFTEMAKRAGIGEMYLIILLKIIGISYLVEFGAQV